MNNYDAKFCGLNFNAIILFIKGEGKSTHKVSKLTNLTVNKRPTNVLRPEDGLDLPKTNESCKWQKTRKHETFTEHSR